MRFRRIAVAVAMTAIAATASANVPSTVLADFQDGTTQSFAAINAANSPSPTTSFTTTANTSDGGSLRLRITDGGFGNGVYKTFAGALPSAGHYVVTADIKVNNASAPIGSFGMALVQGGTTTTEIPDTNAGYVMNLPDNTTTAAALGYQTIVASIRATAAGDLTVYFSTDPSGGTNAPTADGNFAEQHRTGTTNWGAGAEVFIDNITLVGPGNFGEERNFWISIGDNMTNASTLASRIQFAADHNFDAITILARYRSNCYYVPNRTDSTYFNPEPMASGVSTSNDPLQNAIDLGHELGLRVYAAYSCFLVTDGSNTYPSHLSTYDSANSTTMRTQVYNGGSPALQTTADSGDGLWLDPGNPDTRTYTIDVARNLVANYDIDGIIFDRVRYAGTSFGYDGEALQAYGYDADGVAPWDSVPLGTDATFRGHRRQAIATFLSDAYEQLTDIKPWLIVGATPVAFGDSLSDTYNTVLQDWRVWSKQTTPNRVTDFGCLDLITPQFYRQWDSTSPYEAPGANRDLMIDAQFGYSPSSTFDYGLMPGALVNYMPLFFQATNGDTTQAEILATHICDVRTAPYDYAQGFGLYAATGVQSVIGTIESYSTPCGSNVLSTAPTHPDFLMKEGWDTTPTNNITTLAANTSVASQVTLTWSAPAAASDGETPTKYLVYRSTTNPVDLYYDNLVNQDYDVTGTSFLDWAGTGLSTGGTYYYVVVPVDDYNNKAASNQVTASVTIPEYIVYSRVLSNLTFGNGTYQEFTGNWGDSSAESFPSSPSTDTSRAGSRFATLATKDDRARFNVTLPGGTYYYDVYITYDNFSTINCPDCTWRVNTASGVQSGTFDMDGPTHGDTWQYIGRFQMTTGGYLEIDSVSTTNGVGTDRINADAARFTLVGTMPVTLDAFSIE